MVRQYDILRFQVVFCKIMITFRIGLKQAEKRFYQIAALKRQHKNVIIITNEKQGKVWKYNENQRMHKKVCKIGAKMYKKSKK